MLKYDDANEILMVEFKAMKTAYYADDIGYDGEDDQYLFYSFEFVPYIYNQLEERNTSELKKIFEFVEKLFREGDKELAGLARVSIVNDIYDDDEYRKHKDKIMSLCGSLTLKSFRESEAEMSESKQVNGGVSA